MPSFRRVLHIAGVVAGITGVALTAFTTAGQAPAWVALAIAFATRLEMAFTGAASKEPDSTPPPSERTTGPS